MLREDMTEGLLERVEEGQESKQEEGDAQAGGSGRLVSTTNLCSFFLAFRPRPLVFPSFMLGDRDFCCSFGGCGGCCSFDVRDFCCSLGDRGGGCSLDEDCWCFCSLDDCCRCCCSHGTGACLLLRSSFSLPFATVSCCVLSFSPAFFTVAHNVSGSVAKSLEKRSSIGVISVSNCVFSSSTAVFSS